MPLSWALRAWLASLGLYCSEVHVVIGCSVTDFYSEIGSLWEYREHAETRVWSALTQVPMCFPGSLQTKSSCVFPSNQRIFYPGFHIFQANRQIEPGKGEQGVCIGYIYSVLQHRQHMPHGGLQVKVYQLIAVHGSLEHGWIHLELFSSTW